MKSFSKRTNDETACQQLRGATNTFVFNLIENNIEPFSLKKFLLMFFSNRFLKKSQNNISIAALIKYRINKNLVWILSRSFIIIDFLLSPMIFLKILIFGKSLGGESQLSRISINN